MCFVVLYCLLRRPTAGHQYQHYHEMRANWMASRSDCANISRRFYGSFFGFCNTHQTACFLIQSILFLNTRNVTFSTQLRYGSILNLDYSSAGHDDKLHVIWIQKYKRKAFFPANKRDSLFPITINFSVSKQKQSYAVL